MSTAIVKVEPLEISGFKRDPREQRAALLAERFVKFISDYVDPLVQVRLDFHEKGKDEVILGCRTFSQYCIEVLNYSESHIRALIAGRNPVSAIHDGSKNRKPKFGKKSNLRVVNEGQEQIIEHLEKQNAQLVAKVTELKAKKKLSTDVFQRGDKAKKDIADWTDDEYVVACVEFIESTLRPLESDPERIVKVAKSVAAELLSDTSSNAM